MFHGFVSARVTKACLIAAVFQYTFCGSLHAADQGIRISPLPGMLGAMVFDDGGVEYTTTVAKATVSGVSRVRVNVVHVWDGKSRNVCSVEVPAAESTRRAIDCTLYLVTSTTGDGPMRFVACGISTKYARREAAIQRIDIDDQFEMSVSSQPSADVFSAIGDEVNVFGYYFVSTARPQARSIEPIVEQRTPLDAPNVVDLIKRAKKDPLTHTIVVNVTTE